MTKNNKHLSFLCNMFKILFLMFHLNKNNGFFFYIPNKIYIFV